MAKFSALLGLFLCCAFTASVFAQPSSREADEFKPKNPKSLPAKIGLESLMKAVADGDALALLLQLHPDLLEKVDQPVLQFVLEEIHTSLGKPKDDDWTESTQTKKVNGRLSYTTKAKIPFDRGLLEIELSHCDNQITRFEFISSKLENLSQALGKRLVSDAKFNKTIADYYVLRKMPLVYLIFRGEDNKAHEMLHPEIQKQFPIEKAKEVFAAIRAEHGQLKDINYTGLSVNWEEGDKLKNVGLNFDLVCDTNDGQATVNIQFVGFAGAVTGVNVANKEQQLVVEDPKPEKGKTYRHEKENLSEKHIAKFVPFQFEYPSGWEFDKSAGQDDSPNSMKAFRNLDLGDDGTYTQENFAVGSCQVEGSGELATIQLQFLSEQLRGQIEKGFPEFVLGREGEMKFGKYSGYGFEFSSTIPHPQKKKVACWGRVILLSPSAIKSDHGLSIIMLATSEASELKGLADLGVKGQLPILIESFRVNETKSQKKSEEPDSIPLPPPSLPAPPMP